MNRKQTVILWMLGTLLSAVLFVLGVVVPARTTQELAALQATAPTRPPWEAQAVLARVERLREASRANYYMGLAAPVAILGLCTLLTAGRPRKVRLGPSR